MNKPDRPTVTLTVEGDPEPVEYILVSRSLAEREYQEVVDALLETGKRLAHSLPGSKERQIWANDLIEHAIELALSGGGVL